MKIMKFGAEYCAACKALEPIITDLITQNLDHDFISIDVDDPAASEITQQYKIKSIPTTIFANRRDEELFRFTGVKKKNQIQEYIDELS